MIVYFNGEFVRKENVRISPDDRGFVFGDGVYEVIRAKNGQLFQGDAHMQRLRQSLRAVRIHDVDVDAVHDAVRSLLARNDLDEGHAKTYLQITRGAAPRQHAFPDESVAPTVYATVSPHDPPVEKWENGVKVVLRPDQRWARCNIKSTALLPNVLASQEAKEHDAYETVLTREGFVTEGSHSSVMAVVDDTVMTHPLTHRILPSVTRNVVLDLCKTHGISVDQTPISRRDLPEVDELMLLGTTTGIMPVVQVDDWTVADGYPGPMTRTLQTAFRALDPE